MQRGDDLPSQASCGAQCLEDANRSGEDASAAIFGRVSRRTDEEGARRNLYLRLRALAGPITTPPVFSGHTPWAQEGVMRSACDKATARAVGASRVQGGHLDPSSFLVQKVLLSLLLLCGRCLSNTSSASGTISVFA
ncbi:hypothetical protein MTO96_001265 [Rhipicephalus appendiculatus]